MQIACLSYEFFDFTGKCASKNDPLGFEFQLSAIFGGRVKYFKRVNKSPPPDGQFTPAVDGLLTPGREGLLGWGRLLTVLE